MSDPAPESRKLTHRELLLLLVKHWDLHEGLWMLQVHFTFAAGNVGGSLADVIPSGIVGVSNVGLVRVTKPEPEALVIDAAAVNPAPKASTTRPKATAKKPAPAA